MAATVVDSTLERKRWRRRRARQTVATMRPTRFPLHLVTCLATITVVWSFWHQYQHIGFGEWIGPKVRPPLWKPDSVGSSSTSGREVYRGTYLVHGRGGELWPQPVSRAALASGTAVVQRYESNPVVRSILLGAAGFLVLCTAFVVELWARARFRMTILGMMFVTVVFALAFSVFLPFEGTVGDFFVRLPMFLAVAFCPLAWLVMMRSVVRRMSAVS